ncbi:G protein-activated inward rectifier potassium channel 3-like isoform X1 [Branchiostoma floridae x Branchiostoma belcheri]
MTTESLDLPLTVFGPFHVRRDSGLCDALLPPRSDQPSPSCSLQSAGTLSRYSETDDPLTQPARLHGLSGLQTGLRRERPRERGLVPKKARYPAWQHFRNGDCGTMLGRKTFTADQYLYSKSPLLHHDFKQKKKKHVRQRFVEKNGYCNVSHGNIREPTRYLVDIFTTVIDLKWRYNLFIFSSVFITSWLCFGFIWWVICFAHGDFEPREEGFTPCVNEVYGFTSAFLFSVETQTTIGYGSRHITPECPEAVFLLLLQCICGLIINAFLLGCIFAKVAQPKKRAHTLMFSNVCTISKRDGVMCLMFRVGDLRKSHIVEAHVRAQLIRSYTTPEGEFIPVLQEDLDVGYDDGLDRLFLVTPVIVCHEIDEDSPFWDMTPEEILAGDFEVVVILEGTVEATGMTTQARSSYTPDEIKWGHRFEAITTIEDGRYQVDYSKFNTTIEIPTPRSCTREIMGFSTPTSKRSSSRRSSSLSSGKSIDDEDEDKSSSGVVFEDELNGSVGNAVDKFAYPMSSGLSEDVRTGRVRVIPESKV